VEQLLRPADETSARQFDVRRPALGFSANVSSAGACHSAFHVARNVLSCQCSSGQRVDPATATAAFEFPHSGDGTIQETGKCPKGRTLVAKNRTSFQMPANEMAANDEQSARQATCTVEL
jgi:hypothetical protein